MLISVILPVRNGQKYIYDAIESVLAQTHKSFELIIINDGSTDDTVQVVESFSDDRIKLVTTEGLGLVNALNLGISLSNGEYIARLDADDKAHASRFYDQSKILYKDESIGAVFSGYNIINENGTFVKEVVLQKTSKKTLVESLLFTGNHFPLIHPSVMIRKSVIEKMVGYRDYLHCEDRDLWLRMLLECEFHIISVPLIDYRVNFEGVSKSNQRQQVYSGVAAVLNYEIYKKFGIDLYKDKSDLHDIYSNLIVDFFEKKNVLLKFIDLAISIVGKNKYLLKFENIFVFNYQNRRKLIDLLIKDYTTKFN